MEENFEKICKRLDKIEKQLDQLPKVIEFIVAELFDHYAVEPNDFDIKVQTLQSSICDVSQFGSINQSKKPKKSVNSSLTPSKRMSQNPLKEDSSSDSSSEEPQGEWKVIDGPAKVIAKLPEQSDNFTCLKDNVILCTATAIKNVNEDKVIGDLDNKHINDVTVTSKGKVLISTQDDLIISHDGILNSVDGKLHSACEFNGQIVGVSDKGLRCKHHGREGFIKQLTQKIQLKNPTKVRASKKRLFINDSETNIMSILDDNFKIIKAINSSKIPDFCVISDDQFATISSKGIKIVTFDANNLNVDRYVKVEVDGTPVELIKIDYIVTKTEQFILGLGKDKMTAYKIPIKIRE